MLGTYAYYGYRDYARATEHYKKIAQLQPNDPTAYSSLGLIQRRQGRWGESLGNLRKAAELDPGNISYARNLLASLLNGRRWEEARAEQRRLITLLNGELREQMALNRIAFLQTGSTQTQADWAANFAPSQADAPRMLINAKALAVRRDDYAEFQRLDRLQPFFDDDGEEHAFQAMNAAVVYAAHGDQAAARTRLGDFPAQLRARLEREPANPRVVIDLAQMAALLGQPDEAARLARQAAELLPEARDAYDGANMSYWRVQVLAWIGDKPGALAELARLLRLPYAWNSVHQVRTDPWLTPLRGDAPFEALLNDPKNNAPLF